MCVSVCECASVSVCVQFDAWAAKTKTNIGIFCLEIWILAWRSHGKIMELFSEIFVGTLYYGIIPEVNGLTYWGLAIARGQCVNTLRPRQNGRRFADDIFKYIFLNENVWIPIKISLKFVPKGPINNMPALVQIMAWRRPGDKPLSEPMMVCLPTLICVTRPQWVNSLGATYTIWWHKSVSI